MTDTYLTPEARARINIDHMLADAGWVVQGRNNINLSAGRGVAIREFAMADGGYADYLLFVDGQACGVIEAKKEGVALTGVEPQSARYASGVPANLDVPCRPLPFLYESTGVETTFTCGFDPDPRSRHMFSFLRPETLARMLDDWHTDHTRGSLRARLAHLPGLTTNGLRKAQYRAINAIEASMLAGRPRALAQMATGSGKTFMAANEAYRLIKYAGATRILFLVDRGNLGRQALKEFQQFTTPDDGRKFTELYNAQLLGAGGVDPAARVVISTVQRLYSQLSGTAIDEETDEKSASELEPATPVEVTYNQRIPLETFDVIVIDECHRSIYGVWRQVIEYFDAFLIGLTATPSKQTFGFFRRNLVIEYGHDEAVADGVNVDFDVYRIRTKIGTEGSTIEAGLVAKFRDRATRATRLNKLDDDFTYDAAQLDREVVAEDQIRTIISTYRDKLFAPVEDGGIFPGRTDVPKTLIFAKSDAHADDIVRICREVFDKGNDFAVKITYKTQGAKPEDLLASFRNSYNPRIAVTVDMIATGTDVKPLEAVLFMRAVKSRTFFEQMKGRGVRTIDPNDLQAVSADAKAKTHFVLIDAVGVTEDDLVDAQPLDRAKTVPLERLFEQVALGVKDVDTARTIAGRLARLDRQMTAADRAEIADATGDGTSITDLVSGLIHACDPDQHIEHAREANGGEEPHAEQVAKARNDMLAAALKPLAANPVLRQKLLDVKRSYEQVYDEYSEDSIIEAGFSQDARDRARALTASFRAYIEEHHSELDALEILYSRPYNRRLTLKAIKELATTIGRPPYNWTNERLWAAYETLDKSKVRGSGTHVLTDMVSLVRFALEQEHELAPFPLTVHQKFDNWLAQQSQLERKFTEFQMEWLQRIADHIATSLQITRDDFEFSPFAERGGFTNADETFDGALAALMAELNEVLAA